MKQPTISVLLSVFNGASYIEAAVESILHQTFRDFELIIVDDGSVDETSKILDKFTDDRIVRLANEKNLGLIKSLNKALAVAQGEFIARMDADDISLLDRFQKQLVYMREHPEIGVLGTAMTQVDEQGQPISVLVPPVKHELILWQTLFGCAIFHATTMMR
ncbi:glycosyltransferase, partial [Patescibacteria group bacterium]|nr:glycosyltransferase [Patescibacteria group bacterium]